MALAQAIAERLSQNWVLRAIYEEFITTDELFAIVPVTSVTGKTTTYNRESVEPTMAWILVNELLVDSEAETVEVPLTLKIQGGIFTVDTFIEDVLTDVQEQFISQRSRKIKAASKEFRDKFINGDTSVSAKQFDGIKVLCTAAQTVTHDQPLTFAVLDRIFRNVTAGPLHAMAANGRSIDDYYELVRATPGMQPDYLEYKTFNTVFPNVAQYRHTPILKNDNINDDEVVGSCTDGTSWYGMYLHEEFGISIATSKKNGGLRVRGPADMLSAGKFAIRGGVSWYGAVRMGSTKSLTRVSGVCHVVP